jgi:signal transduction histidine kinase
MKFRLGTQWLDDRSSVTRLLQRVLDEAGPSENYVFNLDKDITIFHEGDTLNNIYILLEGTVQLYKKKPHTDKIFPVMELKSGSLLGIAAFTTGLPSLTTAKTNEKCRLLRIPKTDVDSLIEKHPQMSGYIDELILANLLERFRQNIILQMKLDSANKQLKEERNELKQAYRELQEAQNKLVHQEKLATLGQLVAGFAHEVNNPTAALLRSTDTLEQHLRKFMSRFYNDAGAGDGAELSFFEKGKKAGFPDTSTLRERTKILKEEFPKLQNSQIRLMAQMQPELIDSLRSVYTDDPDRIQYFLDQFEFGKMFQNIESAGERISGLVQSLKSYSRADTEDQYEWIDIREGIHDTLQLTSNRIKFYEIYTDLPEVPKIRADAAGLNQVWTNIILNASDVMGKTGSLDIRCGSNEDEVWVSIRDDGPGIEEEILEKIFEPNFTTKKTGKKFGLGLGLSISKEIVNQHGGTIIAENADEGGARFTVRLPLKN